ncbi:hypothetical protein DJ013_01910 [Arcticibacterium luteifluviistationis]|uniref:Uncharacterized protein n=1 Tax=Arcticibacterium luteifluviistationis TaxID=1784714 RepID=A0A2Z4G740_9BACT|nr:hypothetical protein DJ013_01910 [Arcticibacterium luteifluviistationis]
MDRKFKNDRIKHLSHWKPVRLLYFFNQLLSIHIQAHSGLLKTSKNIRSKRTLKGLNVNRKYIVRREPATLRGVNISNKLLFN